MRVGPPLRRGIAQTRAGAPDGCDPIRVMGSADPSGFVESDRVPIGSWDGPVAPTRPGPGEPGAMMELDPIPALRLRPIHCEVGRAQQRVPSIEKGAASTSRIFVAALISPARSGAISSTTTNSSPP